MMRANFLKLAQSGRGNLAIAARRASVPSVNQRLTAMLLPRTVSHQPVSMRLFSASSSVAHQTTPKVDIEPITQTEYHDLADEYLDAVLTKFEELQDEYGEVDVEYSVSYCLSICILSLLCDAENNTNYVHLVWRYDR